MDFLNSWYNKYIILWEKETKNLEEGKSIPEVMVKEDLEKPQNLLQLLKKNLKSNQNKKTEDHISGLFYEN